MSGDEVEMGGDDARSAVASRSEVVWLGVAAATARVAAAVGVGSAAVGVRAAAAEVAAAVEVAMVAVAVAAAAREAAREKAVSPETDFLASQVDWVGVVAAAARGGRAFLASAARSASAASPPGWGDKPRVVLVLGMRPGIGPGLARQGLEQAEPN